MVRGLFDIHATSIASFWFEKLSLEHDRRQCIAIGALGGSSSFTLVWMVL
jgi:hypothetical protein